MSPPTTSSGRRRSSTNSPTNTWKRSTAWCSTRSTSCSRSEPEALVDDRTGNDKEEPREKRGPRPSSESVRIIGADEAAAAIEAGQAAGRRPDDAPRFGDVPPAPEGPRPPLRFPMPGADPSSVAKPPIVGTPATPEELEDEAYLEGLTPTPPDEPD